VMAITSGNTQIDTSYNEMFNLMAPGWCGCCLNLACLRYRGTNS